MPSQRTCARLKSASARLSHSRCSFCCSSAASSRSCRMDSSSYCSVWICARKSSLLVSRSVSGNPRPVVPGSLTDPNLGGAQCLARRIIDRGAGDQVIGRLIPWSGHCRSELVSVRMPRRGWSDVGSVGVQRLLDCGLGRRVRCACHVLISWMERWSDSNHLGYVLRRILSMLIRIASFAIALERSRCWFLVHLAITPSMLRSRGDI